MTLEQLQSMSDAELNELAAVKVMQYDKEGIDIKLMMARGEWNPAGDMNYAMELVSVTNGCLHLKEHGEQGEWAAHFCVYTGSGASAETASKAITIAAILAKEE